MLNNSIEYSNQLVAMPEVVPKYHARELLLLSIISNLQAENRRLSAKINCLKRFLNCISGLAHRALTLQAQKDSQLDIIQKVTGINFKTIMDDYQHDPVRADNVIHLLSAVLPALVCEKVKRFTGRALMKGEYGDGAIYGLPSYRFLFGPSNQKVEVYQEATRLIQYIKSCLTVGQECDLQDLDGVSREVESNESLDLAELILNDL